MKSHIMIGLVSLSLTMPLLAASPVTLTEQQVKIPTYLIGPPEVNPQFYFGGASQGAQQHIYPYPAYDNLTTEKVDKPYKMVCLENEYLKIGILPDSGGKIFDATDKTNGYHFFYKQSVIKPGLISLLGAWISGGVEWDVPHHHRATSFLPVQYTTEESPDGSKTCWVGELELRDRMRWAVGITLHPGKSYIEASFRVINRTPLPVSMLCFSNVAVHVNDDYQIIFPPSTQWGTGHGKRDFTPWPIDTNGVDLSWYKNIPTSRSVFAWNYSDDFMAGYDHGKHVGTMAIADHNVVPGKKFFTWGDGPQGHKEDTLLTDNDGPYIELMVGAYSDNQPDYSWLAPFETRAWTQYWYPFRDIEGVKNANTEAAVNLAVADGRARVGFVSTSDHPNATVLLKWKDQTLIEEKIAISPAKAYIKEVPIPPGADEHDLRASLSDNGKELVAYSPMKLTPEPQPQPVTPFAAPAQLKSNDELYLAGLRMDQFRAPGVSPEAYWLEALRRDPGDVRVNTIMGVEAIRGGRYGDAEKYLRAAVARASDRYTTPKDGEPYYYLGLALKAQGKTDEAFNHFSKATWSGAWRGPGYFEMAQIALIRGDPTLALTCANRSLAANSQSPPALALKSQALRKLGRTQEAQDAVAAIKAIDPLDVSAAVEGLNADVDRNQIARLAENFRDFPATALEVAADYMNAGAWEEASGVLRLALASKPSSMQPLMEYDLAFCAQKLHQGDKTKAYWMQAAAASPQYAFPFQMEQIPVLEAAMEANPKDARAPYYLGNLLFDSQPERARQLWQKSADLGADFPEVYHNLALAYTRQGQADQRDKARALLEKGASPAGGGGNAMIFAELDRLYEEDGVDPAKRLAILEAHQSVLNRDDVISREINLDIFAGRAQAARALLKSRFFRGWEGGGRYSLGDAWVNANLVLGRQHMAAKQYQDALADFQAALQLPSNLQEAAGSTASRRGEINYDIGTAYDALGDVAKATAAWTQAAENPAADPTPAAGRGGRGGRGGAGGVPAGQFSGRGGTMGGVAAGTHLADAALYFQALALQKLGRSDQAKTLFHRLLDTGNRATAAATQPTSAAIPAQTRWAIADAHCLSGLGNIGLANTDKAREELTAALKTSPDHLAAHLALQSLPK